MNHKKTLLIAAFIGVLMTISAFQTSPEYKVLFEKAKFTMETKGDLNGAINLFNDIIKKYPKEREYAAKSQLYIGLCYEKLGAKEAQKAYQKVVSSYPEQTETVKLANEKLSLLLRTQAPAKSSEITIRRVWSGLDANGEGGPSPDGRYLSFTDWGGPALAIHDLVTDENRRITNYKPGDTYAYPDYSIFSPDGKQIAYRWWIGRDVCEIRTIKPDGSDERVLYRTKENYPSKFNWSPDGMYLLTKLSERPVLIAVEDGSINDVAIENPGMMCFSPDGNYIVYDTPQDKNSRQSNIFVLDRIAHRTSMLVGHPSDDKLLGWSPDGKHVLFSSDRRGSIDAWLISISGGQPTGAPEMVRSDIGGLGYGMGFTQSDSYFFSNWGESRDVFVAKLDIQTGKLLSPPAEVAEAYLGSNWGPDFSGDGKSLAYVNGNDGIVIQSFESNDKKIIKPQIEIRRTNRMAGLRWAPDSRSLVGTGVIGEGREGLFRVNLPSGETKLFFEPAHPWIQTFDLSPDGKKVFYQGIPEGGSLYVWDSESGEENLLLAGSEAWSLAVSPDGKQLAYFRSSALNGANGLFVLPSEGGTPKLLVEALDSRGVIAWSPDGRQLVYAVPSANSAGNTPAKMQFEIWRVPSQGGVPQRLGLTVDGFIMSLQIHPDSQRIVYETLRFNSEIWVMENFLPKGKAETNSQLTMRKLDYEQLNEPFARLSPDGKKMAYVVYVENSPKRIEILDLSSGVSKVLIDSGATGEESLVWSPGSDKIAYTFHGKELRVSDIDGTNSRILLKDSEDLIYPTDWSRDGKKIMCEFLASDRTLRVGTVTSDGQMKVLASGNYNDYSGEAKISPDGAYVAFSFKEKDGNTDIYVWTSDGSRKVRVTEQPGRDENPVWSPDGKYLVFLSDRNRSVDLWGVQMDDGATVGAPFVIKRDIGWRTRIYDFTASGKLSLLMVGGAEPANLFMVPVDQESGSLSGTIDPISVYPTDHFFPKYSPNGKMIAYNSRKGQIGFPKLFVMDEKGAERELPLQGHFVVNVAWHPDNRSLFFAGMDKTFKAGIYEISLENDEIKSVYSGMMVDMQTFKDALININMLPDARKIMFFRYLEKGDVEILTCETGGQQPAVVLPRVKMPIWGLPSPNGENICYRIGDSLMVVSVSNGAIKYIGSSTVNLEGTWAPNGEKLMFREASGLKIFSLKENSARTLYKAPAGKTIGGMEMYANSCSPNGSRFIITERDTSATSASPQKLIMINLNDGSTSELGEAPGGYPLSELRWSPDGSKVIATGQSISSKSAPIYEYWVMENFLPK